MLKKISPKEAEKINRRNGMDTYEDDGRTFWATNEDETETYPFGTNKEREKAIKQNAEVTEA